MLNALRSRSPSPGPQATPPHSTIPTILLTAATPGASISASPLAPRAVPSQRRLVPKKSLLQQQQYPIRRTPPPPEPIPIPPAIAYAPVNTNDGPKSTFGPRFSRSTRSSIKVFVEPSEEDGDMLVVKKKKSRAALESIKWALGDRTNHGKDKDKGSSDEKPKKEEKDGESSKWKWTLGRSRKDSKEKEKEKPGKRSPSPAPTETYRRKSTESATLLRNNSTTSSKFLTPDYQPSTLSRLSDLTHPSGCHPREAELAQDENKSGSLALRAMRSVKSMARMGSWAQLRSGTPIPPAEKEKEKGSKRVKEKKEKKRKGIPTMKSGDASGSSGGESWLVGAPSHAGSPNRFVMVEAEEPVIRNSKESTTTMASQSSSSSQDYGTRRASTHSASTFSSSIEPASSNGHSSNGHSSNSSGSYQNQIQQSSSSRMSSSRSKQSSSTLSGLSIMSSLNSTVKAPRTEKGKKKEVKDTREREDARRRGSLANVFELAKTAPIGQPIMSPGDPFSSSMSSASFFTAVEEAMPADDDNTRTRPARPRPMSEQLLRPRPKGIIPNDGEDMSISLVSAATSDLCDLINRLDLSATPEKSPAKQWLADHETPPPMPRFPSIPTLEQLERKWPDVPSDVGSSAHPIPRGSNYLATGEAAAELLQRKIMEEPSITSLRPYRMAAPRRTDNQERFSAATADSFVSYESPLKVRALGVRGQSTKKAISRPKLSKESPSQKKSHSRSMSGIIGPEARRGLGMKGTLGAPADEETNHTSPSSDDIDSDIPDELQVILSGQSEGETRNFGTTDNDTLSFHTEENLHSNDLVFKVTAPSPSPYAHYHEHDDHHEHDADVDDAGSSEDTGVFSMSDDHTGKRSFDFTGEINKLAQAGNRESFVDQLEQAFKTPAAVKILGAKTSTTPQAFSRIDEETPVPGRLNSFLAVQTTDTMPPKRSNGELNTNFRFGGNSRPPSRQLAPETSYSGNLSAHEASLLSNLDASMVALANLNLSLVHPSSKLDTRPQPQPQSQQDSPSFDSSMIALANINLSLIHPSSGSSLQPRQHLLSLESDTSSKRNARLAHVSPYANDRARARLPSLESDTSSKFHARSQPSARISPHIRNPSEVSAASFGYAQPNDHLLPIIDAPHTAMQANFPPPAFPVPAAPSPNHARNESMASIPSISSYGKVINPGVHNPFGYDYLLQHNSSYSMEMADTSAPMEGNSKSFGEQDKEKRRRKRMSTDSDKSSFYFRGNSMSRGHRRDDSIASFSANIPPISFHNTSFNRFHHKRSQSSESASSLAHAYGTYGANGGKAAWAMHRPDNSVDSILSDFSASRLGRPGIGDKMFDTAEQSYGAPLSAISASPSGSEMGRGDGLGARSSFDSILDDARSSFDSIFDRPANRASSVSSASIFGNDDPPPPGRKMLFPQAADQKFRPLSIISNTSHYSAPREDDTMVSMLGGEHVRRKSVGSSFEASPCFRAKRKHAVLQMRPGDTDDDADVDGSPNKARVVEKASVISKASVKFGAERMSRARRGRLERQSLEDSALSAEGEESTRASDSPGFRSRPSPVFINKTFRDESFTNTLPFTAAPPDTPPLSHCSSDGSQSSIDVAHLNILLKKPSPPRSDGTRLRERGQGHRHPASQASRKSFIETIAEEQPQSPTNATEQEPHVDIVDWDEEALERLRKYYQLRNEALQTLQMSKATWEDTDFSRFALSSFRPPHHPNAIQALLEHSQKTYGPLPSELVIRRPRSRVNSRATPYNPRTRKPSLENRSHGRTESMEQAFTCISPPVLSTLQPVSPIALNTSEFYPLSPPKEIVQPAPRPRVASNVRRSALGWSKRRTMEPIPSVPKPAGGISTSHAKENTNHEATGLMTSPNATHPLNRPRPRARARPQSQATPSMMRA